MNTPKETLDQYGRKVTESGYLREYYDEALQALHAATIAALPKHPDGTYTAGFSKGYIYAVKEMKAAIDELYGVKK